MSHLSNTAFPSAAIVTNYETELWAAGHRIEDHLKNQGLDATAVVIQGPESICVLAIMPATPEGLIPLYEALTSSEIRINPCEGSCIKDIVSHDLGPECLQNPAVAMEIRSAESDPNAVRGLPASKMIIIENDNEDLGPCLVFFPGRAVFPLVDALTQSPQENKAPQQQLTFA